MDSSVSISGSPAQERGAGSPAPAWDRLKFVLYALALGTSITTWFLLIHAPLWLDETGSYFAISGGFWRIPFRQDGLSFPAYSYILWIWTRLFGTSEIAMRFLSVLAMLGAVYLLYLAARELFERDVATIAAVVFCLHPVVIFTAIDIRPYAFAVLAANAAILLVLRLRDSDSYGMAALFGVAAACMVWFHYLFAVILPALVVCYFALKRGDGKTRWRQFGVALGAFVLAFLPVVPGVLSMFRTGATHVHTEAPAWTAPLWMMAPGQGLLGLALASAFAVLLVAAFRPRQQGRTSERAGLQGAAAVSLGLIPLFILFAVSRWTPMHVLMPPAHCLPAVPGIALCWAYLAKGFRIRSLRLMFCVFFVLITAMPLFLSPLSRKYRMTWKYALQFVEHNASADNAAVLFCSDFVESNYVAMPLDSPRESRLFAQLSYYPLTVPVVPLPQQLNDEARGVVAEFLSTAEPKHERFLAMGQVNSYGELDWLAQRAADDYSVHKLGVFDGVEVLEFVPRVEQARHDGPAKGQR